MDNEFNPVIGIDLGTTYSAIARWNGREAEHYQTAKGPDTLQSVVYVDPKTGEITVGQTAANKGRNDPQNMKLGVKRDMDNGAREIVLGGRTFTPVQLSTEILKHLYKGVVEKFPTGRFKSRGTVVTVPYYFKAHQCANTRSAADAADIRCIGLLQEPIAASLAYAWQLVAQAPDRDLRERVLVFDLGGGTFDLTLFDLNSTRDRLTFEVAATGGDDRLGGMDFDDCLVKLILSKAGITSLNGNIRWEQLVLEAATAAKITLSDSREETVFVADVAGTNIDVRLTRNDFEDCVGAYRTEIGTIISRLFDTAESKPSEVDRVIMVGGSSRIPLMKSILGEVCGEDRIYKSLNPDLCVAEGAAMYAAYLDDRSVFGREIEITTRTCHALGVETSGDGFYPIIRANTKAPCERTEQFRNDSDDMTTLDINILQGSSKIASGNTSIGTVTITGLPKRKKGDLEISVTFRVSAEQVLSVVVKVEGKTKTATIKYS